MNVGNLSFEEYVSQVEAFHGYAAPGMLVGGFMVELAKSLMPPGALYDSVSETKSCLPDAIQLLTPCTVGNGWLKVFNLGRYALTLYDKHEGAGMRVWLDADKLDAWPEIKKWFFILAKKEDQDKDALKAEIMNAGHSICSSRPIRVRLQDLKKRKKDKISRCPLCGEAFPARDGGVCRGCQGEAPYEDEWSRGQGESPTPGLVAVPIEEAVGKEILHDMTEIIPGRSKGAAFIGGQRLSIGDLCRLQHMGKRRVYVRDDGPTDSAWVHEDDAARAFAKALSGQGVAPKGPVREGKINMVADRAGLFVADADRLASFNLVPGAMCACRQSHSVVEPGMNLAAARSIPLLMPRSHFEQALAIAEDEPLFQVLEMRRARAGILVTGSEIFQGLVEDKFIPIISSKLEKYGSTVVQTRIAPDDKAMIRQGLDDLLRAGADLIVTTAGLSVDPDDVTRQALLDSGLENMLFGAPIVPGAMTLLGSLGGVQVIGVPACALYHKTTSFEILLPRLLAGLRPSRRDLAGLAHGALCLECKTCTYPKCTFGR